MAKLKMPIEKLGTEMSPVSPDPDADIQEQGGVQDPSELIGGTNTSESVQVDLTGPVLTGGVIITAVENFNCYYNGQFLTFKKDQEIGDDTQLLQYLAESGAPLTDKLVE